MNHNGGDIKSNIDKAFATFKNYDFANAKPVAKTPYLANAPGIGRQDRPYYHNG